VLHAYIRDIQGNVAGVYEAKAGKKSLELLNDYYAYGGLTADSRGQDRNRYKHTGKELVTDLGLNSYDFTARWQYPMAGRFDMPDALAAQTPWNSPYSFCGGDPINFVDPTGNIILFINGYIGFGSPEAGAPYWNGEKSGFVKGRRTLFS
ncbi:MAG: RHS repeat-associated core domain-containing protein, partial [Muribaculaceae bacterium]|nr:RHS repeat-associated core domain-containing protein [Muribaculaceae bacterium]